MDTMIAKRKCGFNKQASEAEGPCLTVSLACDGGGKNFAKHRERIHGELRRLKKEADQGGKAEDLFEKAERLLGESERWGGDYEGVCLYVSAYVTRVFKLPYPPVEKSELGERFILRPAADAMDVLGDWLVLNISLKSPRLFKFDGETASLLKDVELPESVYGFSEQGALDSGQQAHVQRSRGSESPVLAQQGVSSAKSPRELNEPVFMREVGHALSELSESKELPLIVIGDPKVVSRFLDTYRHTGGEVVIVEDAQSHPDASAVSEICGKIAWERQQDCKANAVRAIAEASEASDLFSNNVKDVYEAALQGRICKVVVACDEDVWFREGKDGLPHAAKAGEAGAYEALDRIFQETLLKEGEATTLPAEEIPGGKSVAAVFRW